VFQVLVTMKDGKTHIFEAQSASQALEQAEKRYPGYEKLVARSETAVMNFGRRRVT